MIELLKSQLLYILINSTSKFLSISLKVILYLFDISVKFIK